MKHKTCLPLTYKSTKAEACLIKRRKELRVMLTFAYPKLSKDILNWVFDDHKNEKPSALFVVPLYAYKPSGDSRPDRGLLPLLWAMFPSLVRKDNTLVIIYSKHTPSNWKEILNQRGNELWNSILEFSGALIVDKTGDGLILK